MGSGRGGEKYSGAGAYDPSDKGKFVVGGSSLGVDQLTQGMAGVNVDTGLDDGWEVYGRKTKNKAAKSGGRQTQATSNAWGEPDTVQMLGMRNRIGSGKGPGNISQGARSNVESRGPGGRGNSKLQSLNHDYAYCNQAFPPSIQPPRRNGSDWNNRSASSQSSDNHGSRNSVLSANTENVEDVKVDNDSDSDVLDDTDDELLSDDFDSDASEKSHETYKKDRWFKKLFEDMDSLTVEQISEPERQWHCPACRGGPGAIDWYGLQPLITHAKTKKSKRVKLHRILAELLEEELRRRGTSVVPAGEVFGTWKGLDVRVEKKIVWPPMVMIMNTIHDKDENDKWIGMGNQELLDYFSDYDAVKARHSYGPNGHRGISVLIFESSAVGYSEAERLNRHFEDNGRERTAWESRRVAFYPGGQRQLYGYMAQKQDLEHFNQHSQGKLKNLRFEMLSYQEMVVKQLKQMSEDNQQLVWFKDKVAKEQKHSKALEEAYGIVSERYRKTLKENRIVRQRTKMHHEQNKEEMNALEKFFEEQLKMIYDARKAKEDDFEKIQQEERQTVKQSHGNPVEDHRNRVKEIEKFIKCQDHDMEEFATEREKLIELQTQKMLEMNRRHWEEKVALEEEFDGELAQLMNKYTPRHSEH